MGPHVGGGGGADASRDKNSITVRSEIRDNRRDGRDKWEVRSCCRVNIAPRDLNPDLIRDTSQQSRLLSFSSLLVSWFTGYTERGGVASITFLLGTQAHRVALHQTVRRLSFALFATRGQCVSRSDRSIGTGPL